MKEVRDKEKQAKVVSGTWNKIKHIIHTISYHLLKAMSVLKNYFYSETKCSSGWR